VFKNRVLRRISGPKRNDVIVEWRKLRNEGLHNLYLSPDIIRQIKSSRMRWVGYVARLEEEKKAYRVLVRKPEGKRPLGVPSHRWEDEIRMDLRKIGCGEPRVQNRDQWQALVNMVMILRFLAPGVSMLPVLTIIVERNTYVQNMQIHMKFSE
jgi:hypothetical protein